MALYELQTNEGKFFVEEEPTTEQCFRYSKMKTSQGMELKDVVFTYSPVWTSKVEDVIKAGSRK